MTVSEQPLLTVADVAEILSTGERFVRRLVAERRIRLYKIGGKVRFAREDVDEFIVSSRREAGAVMSPEDLAAHWRLVDIADAPLDLDRDLR